LDKIRSLKLIGPDLFKAVLTAVLRCLGAVPSSKFDHPHWPLIALNLDVIIFIEALPDIDLMECIDWSIQVILTLNQTQVIQNPNINGIGRLFI
jgi:hypothetical protein